jgi:hypothetical protein
MLGVILDEIRREGIESHGRIWWGKETIHGRDIDIVTTLTRTPGLSSQRSSAVIIGVDVLDRVNYLMDELHGDARDDSFRFGEGTL